MRVRMKKLVFFCLLLFPPALSAQNATFDSAYFAWERGQYITALDGMLRVLRSAQGDAYHDRIALLTGELYKTTELTTDGRNIAWSADGRYGLYETGSGASRVTRLIERRNGTFVQAREIPGYSAAFAADGSRLVALQPVETPEITQARAQLTSLSGGAATQQRQRISALENRAAKIIIAGMNGRSIVLDSVTDISKQQIVAAREGGELYVIGVGEGDTVPQIYRVAQKPVRLTNDAHRKSDLLLAGSRLIYTTPQRGFGIVEANGNSRFIEGGTPSVSSDGVKISLVTRQGDDYVLQIMDLNSGVTTTLKKSAWQISNSAISPDGKHVAYQTMPREDWEIFVVDANGQNDRRITREIQHDQFPRFVDNNTILAVKGEARHRRSYLYDVNTGEATRLFHNNLVRTVSQEYMWNVSPDGKSVLVQADRDGNTISPERGVYVVDLTTKVSRDELVRRLTSMRASEVALRDHAQKLFTTLRPKVAATVADISKDRIYTYARDLFAFDSKHITQPGNAPAIQYLEKTLRSFGYEPELQWFEPRPGIRTANVVATLKGTTNPDLIYIIGSHFDSRAEGPGADDNTSGTTALLEAARVVATRPQAGTIKFAFFTGEEAGLLGSREFVRRAVANKDKVVAALNNDMVGWRNDQRYDNTIRYSNDGIRDLQHSAALLFSNLITYDSRYYQSTDAHAFWDGWGDIIGGIGSYPILGNPHYHQPHDVLETIDHQLVAEVSKTTTATIMWLANSKVLP